MKVTLWGTRGSIASPGPDTTRYGGNTSCVEVRNSQGDLLVLDAGTGIRRLRPDKAGDGGRIDVLLTHLHMDHVQGLGFFEPLFDDDRVVHLWGPASATRDLRSRLSRYLAPPLFPVRLRDLPSDVHLHDVRADTLDIPGFTVHAAPVFHPGPTLGYRIESDDTRLAYIPDHEPMLCSRAFAGGPHWTSGHDLALDTDVLLHDTQFTPEEYEQRVGWGHSTLEHAIAFARRAGARRLVPFHHDPSHGDTTLDEIYAAATASGPADIRVHALGEGDTIELPWVGSSL